MNMIYDDDDDDDDDDTNWIFKYNQYNNNNDQ